MVFLADIMAFYLCEGTSVHQVVYSIVRATVQYLGKVYYNTECLGMLNAYLCFLTRSQYAYLRGTM